MSEHRDAAVVRRWWSALRADAELVTPDCVILAAGNNQRSGEHKGRQALAQYQQEALAYTGGTGRVEQRQLFFDGHGHVVGVRRMIADGNGRHLDSLGASVYTIAGDQIAGIENCEEDLDRFDEFWGGSGPGLGTDWRADIDAVLRLYQRDEQNPSSVRLETCTADVRYHVPGHHMLSGDFQGPDGLRQWVERAVRETDGTLRMQPEHVFADGHGHVIVIRHITADRRGRHLDAHGALHWTLRGGLVSDGEVYEEDLDAIDEFWA